MDERIPLIILPAFMCTRTLREHQIDALADIADITFVDLTTYDTVTKMADAVLEQAPDHFAIAGLSLGGFTAFEILRRAPGRITRLALVSTTARADAPERLVARRAQVETVRSGGFEQVVEGFMKVLQPPEAPWSADLAEKVRGMVHEAGQDCFFKQQNAMATRPDSRETAGTISCPTMVIHGRDDQSWPFENAEELARLIPDARLRVIENAAGHFPTLTQPQEMTMALREWLSD